MSDSISRRAAEALRGGDFGEDVGDGLYIKDLGRVTQEPDRSKGEVATAEPVEKRKRMTLKEREELPRILAARLMDYYIENLNNNEMLNPIRDGIPVCPRHGWPPGCTNGCKDASRKLDHTLGDVFTFVQEIMRKNYASLLQRRPELKGWISAKL